MSDWEYKPAGDFGLDPGRQLRSLDREAGLVSAVAHWSWCALANGYLRAAHRFRVTGIEHLPAAPPFIVVANHGSHLDAIVLSAAMPRRLRERAFPIAAGDTFFETPAMAAFAAIFLNALPMWRRSCGAHAMETLRTRLQAGGLIYLLFPEGTRSRTGEMAKFRSGIGMLVAGTNVPVIPCRIAGAHEAMPPGARLPRPVKISLTIGPARTFREAEDSRAGWAAVAAALEADVRGLAVCRAIG